jgi:hypothetical protein
MSDDFFFDPTEQEGSRFELVPIGDYTAEVIEADDKQPSSGDGRMLALTWKISEGDYEGRQIWETLCYQHSNTQTQDIARRRIKDLCVAFGITEQIKDPSVFKFKPVHVRVGVRVDKSGRYDDQNKIMRVKPLTSSNTEPQAAQAPQAAASPKAVVKPGTAGPGPAPWKSARAG